MQRYAGGASTDASAPPVWQPAGAGSGPSSGWPSGRMRCGQLPIAAVPRLWP